MEVHVLKFTSNTSLRIFNAAVSFTVFLDYFTQLVLRDLLQWLFEKKPFELRKQNWSVNHIVLCLISRTIKSSFREWPTRIFDCDISLRRACWACNASVLTGFNIFASDSIEVIVRINLGVLGFTSLSKPRFPWMPAADTRTNSYPSCEWHSSVSSAITFSAFCLPSRFPKILILMHIDCNLITSPSALQQPLAFWFLPKRSNFSLLSRLERCYTQTECVTQAPVALLFNYAIPHRLHIRFSTSSCWPATSSMQKISLNLIPWVLDVRYPGKLFCSNSSGVRR